MCCQGGQPSDWLRMAVQLLRRGKVPEVRDLLSHGSLKAKKLFIDTIQALEKDLLL